MQNIREYKFERLEVYKLSENLIVQVYSLLKKFPKDEVFGIVSQIKRSTISIALNIVEGSTNRTTKDFIRFITISIGSLVESRAALMISVKLGFLNSLELDPILNSFDEIFFKLLALKKSLEKSESEK